MKWKLLGITAAWLLAGLGIVAPRAGALNTAGVDIHGFISQGYLYSDEYNYLAHNSADGSFEFNEMGVNFSKQLSDRLRVGMQLFSRDLGDVSNNKVTLDWAYGDYRWRDWLGLRVGKIKLPLGLYNETRDMDMLRTSIVMPQGVYREVLRETTNAASGAGLYGNIPLGVIGSLDYQAIAGSYTADYDSGQGKYTNNLALGLATVTGEPDYDTAYCGGLRWETPLEGLLLGYSTLNGNARTAIEISASVPVLGGMTTVSAYDWFIHIVSAEYTWSNLVLSAEYYWVEKEIESILGNHDTTGLSYYLAASYRFNELFTLGAYYSEYYPNKDDKEGNNLVVYGLPAHGAWEKDWAMTLRFDINDFWVFKLEGHMVDGTANVLLEDNSDSDWEESDWYYGAAKFTFSF